MDSYSDYDQAFTSSVKSSKTSYTSPKQTRTVAYETDLKEIDQYLQYNSDFYDLQSDNSRVKTTYTSPKQTKTIVYETDLRENDQHVHYKTGSDRVNADLRSENDRLSSKLSEKMRIIEEWKHKYSELEANNSNVETLYAENANLNVEIHRLKDELSRVRSGESDLHKLKTHIEIISREKNELHVLLSEKENIIVQLRNDLEAAKGMRRRVETNEYNFESSRIALIEKDNVISELRLKLSRLEEQVLSVNEWKTKSLSIAAENQRLIRALEERGKEIEMMRTRNSSVERVNVVNVVSVQEKKLEAMLSEKTKEIEALRVRLSEKERERVVMSPVKSEYQEKYVLISSENEKLNAVICAKQKEIETLTAKLNQHHELEAKLRLLIQEKNKLVIERDSVVQERTRLESRLIEKDHAYDVLRVKVREAERPSQEFVELKQRLAIVLSENERLEAFIAQKKKEIEVLNARSLEYHDLELKLKLSIEKNNEIVVQKETAVEEKKRLEGFIAEITEEYEALSLKFRETEKIYSEIADLKSQLSVTISENERLSVLVIEREKELKCLESEIVQYKTSIEEYKKTIEHNKRVIEDGKRVIVEKEREFESHKTSHVVKSKTIESHENVVRHQVSSPVVVVKQESHVMSSEVARLEREIHMREAQVRQLEQRVALLLIQNKQLMQEREIIDTTFSCEVKELESLRLRSSELSIMNMQLKMYEEEKEETLKLMDKDRRLFEKSLYEKELVIKDLQAKSIAHVQRVAYFSELKARLARITNENERLVIEVQEKSREIETLRTEIHQLNVRNSTRVMVQETHTSEILLTDKIREINSLKARIVELEKGSYLADELSEKLRLSSTKYESIISSLNLRLSEMEALRVRCTQLSDIETKLTLVMRERDEAVNYERLNRNELASYQERIVRLEAQIVELNSYKQHNISSPKIVHIETNKTFEKEAELNLCRQEIARYQEKVIKLEAQITELSALKQHQVQILNAPSKVVHVETKNVEKENELSKVIIQLKEKLEVASKEIERLNAVVSQKETQIVSLKKIESSKNTETLVLVQREKEELIKEKKRLSVMCEEYEREIEVLRLNVREIEVFGIEKQRLLEIINTKTREIQMLEQTLAVFESEKLSLKQIACEKEKVIEEMELKLFAKNSVNELRMNHQVSFGGSEAKRQLKNSATEKTLKSKLSYMSGFNDDFESILIEREQLEAQVAEKQKNIKELQIKVASAEKELVGSGELKSKVTLLDSESKRLNNVAMERLTKLNASEQQLRESTKEKSLLGIEVSEKKIEVNLLRSKVSELEVKAKLVTELQGKLAMMVLENDRLTKDLDEKNQFITDLKNKYATLEGLYLLVRGNMKKPEAVEKKYQDMIGAIEQVEHKLGLYGRSKAMKKTISVQSILQMDAGQSQSYSLNVSPLSESKMMVESKAFSVTTKSTPTIQVQKAMF